MNQKRILLPLSFLLLGLTALVSGKAAVAGQQSSEQKDRIEWVDGPLVARLGDVADIKIPAGYRFTGKEGTKKFLELTQNPPNGSELGTIIPIVSSEDDSKDSKQSEMWFVIFEFNEVGYVKDDDKDKLDADALLRSIRESTEEANKERAHRGWPAYHINSWYKAPFYDTTSKNLTWAIQGYSAASNNNGEDRSVNYSVRILGRRGTMNADLVLAPDIVDKVAPNFDKLLGGFSFLPGSRYAEFRPGDKVAAYGLATLVAGGATAIAAKTGLLAKLWKLIVVAIAAVVGFLKRAWASLREKLSGKRSDESPQQG